MLCDGSEILEGPLKGRHTDNLNGEGRFLRGGNLPGTLQEDALQVHQHSGAMTRQSIIEMKH